MDINKLKKVRNTLRLQFGGGVPNQTLSLNDINQFRKKSLNPTYITNLYNKDNTPITEPLSYQPKLSQQSQSLMEINSFYLRLKT